VSIDGVTKQCVVIVYYTTIKQQLCSWWTALVHVPCIIKECMVALFDTSRIKVIIYDINCPLLQDMISTDVDIGLVHHVAVRVFSCTLSEECYLNYNVMTNMSTCMSLALTRLCGEC